jgi:hypothetical protein
MNYTLGEVRGSSTQQHGEAKPGQQKAASVQLRLLGYNLQSGLGYWSLTTMES